jgi:cell division septum initiation protein DivIVA
MGQQISVEAALDAFRKEYGKVVDENVLLKAHISELEGELSRLQAATEAPPASKAGSPHIAGDRSGADAAL